MKKIAVGSQKFFEQGYTVEDIRSRHGRVGHCFLGVPDVKPLVLFTENMNDLYYLIFVFDNTPPLTLTEDEFIGW
jgi:hypothetical protein